MYREYDPVFVLSTGRSGTKFLASLMQHSDLTDAYHEAEPRLMSLMNYAFHHQHRKETLQKIIEAARFELILKSFIKGKIYFEANHCLTFFASQLNLMFPESRFIVLVRHPGDFVASAARKGFLKNENIWEAGRIKMNNRVKWSKLSHIEKLAWLWTSTHLFIDKFLKTISEERYFLIRFEEMVSQHEKLADLLMFTGLDDINSRKLIKLQDERVNELKILAYEPDTMRKNKDFPAYAKWDPQMINSLKKYTGDIPAKYGYNL